MAEGFQKGRPPALAPNGTGINILDFGMLWVQSLAEYIQITKDHTFLADMYPTLEAFLNYLIGFENSDTGLLDLPMTHWSKGVYLDPIANMNRYGQSTAINSFYVSTLLKAASLARAYNRLGDEYLWEQKATTIQTEINNLLYLPQEGRYITTIFDGIKYEPTPHAQAWPLAFGLVPSDETESVADSLLELLSDDPTSPNVEIYGMAWVLEALGEAGYIPEALDIIQTYYGYMIDAGATTWWEQFNSDKYYWSSLSHGWGSSPTWFLSTYLLGGRWVSPDTWEVRPALTGVFTASGAVPLPSGLLDIAWTRESCTKSFLDVTSPTGTSGIVILQLPKVESLVLNDLLIFDNGIPLADYVSIFPDRIEIVVSEAGNYHLDIREICE
jgi:hypothetical protein